MLFVSLVRPLEPGHVHGGDLERGGRHDVPVPEGDALRDHPVVDRVLGVLLDRREGQQGLQVPLSLGLQGRPETLEALVVVVVVLHDDVVLGRDGQCAALRVPSDAALEGGGAVVAGPAVVDVPDVGGEVVADDEGLAATAAPVGAGGGVAGRVLAQGGGRGELLAAGRALKELIVHPCKCIACLSTYLEPSFTRVIGEVFCEVELVNKAFAAELK